MISLFPSPSRFDLVRRALLLVGLTLGLAACNKSEATPSASASGSAAGAKALVTLLNVSYDPTGELYADFNAHFAKKWEAEHQQKVIVDKRGTRAVAEAYLKELYSPEGQEIAAKHYYRPRNADVVAKYKQSFPAIQLFNIGEVFGGW